MRIPSDDQSRVLLNLTLPDGGTCQVRVEPQDTVNVLIDLLVNNGLLRPGRYDLILEGRKYPNPFSPLGMLISPDATEVQGEIIMTLRSSYRRMQLLYGCPTAVTEQAEQLAGCMVTRTSL